MSRIDLPPGDDEPIWRVQGFEGVGATHECYDGIENWRAEAQYSARVRAAIEPAERFSLSWTGIDEHYVAALRSRFTDAEIVDLSNCIGQYIAYWRLVNILDLDSRCALAPQETAVSH